MQEIIKIIHGITRLPERRMAAPVDFTLRCGEHIAIYGKNGSGKTRLVDILRAAYPLQGEAPVYDFAPSPSPHVSDNVRYVAFRDIHGDGEAAYYQQRWNKWDETSSPTVAESLGDAAQWSEEISALMVGDDAFCSRQLHLLSSGELRKFHLAKALRGNPRVLIIDNPYIGLDVAARQTLTQVLQALAERISLILVVSDRADIPPFITHVVHVENLVAHASQPVADFLKTPEPTISSLSAADKELLESLLCRDAFPTATDIIRMNDVSVVYDGRAILQHVDWMVKSGECWALQGGNGAGKSTFLSLVCADNPAAYACNITLFGKRRGRGESIWDIKRHIGYVSPEMARTYRRHLPVIDIVASGLHDTVGLYRKPTDAEREVCRGWLRLWGVEAWDERSFMHLSDGEQRLVLLIRAFVKNPALLVLDEPFHGLDRPTRHRAMQILEACMRKPGRTLIMVSHHADQLPPCINRRLTLEKGRVQTVE